MSAISSSPERAYRAATRFSIGLSNFVFGLSNFVFGLSNFVFGLSNFVFGLSNFVFGLPDFVFGLSNFVFEKNRIRRFPRIRTRGAQWSDFAIPAVSGPEKNMKNRPPGSGEQE